MFRSNLCVLMVICLTGCAKTIINRGYDSETAEFNSIIVGKDNTVSVTSKLGTPTFRSSVLRDNGDYCWYYASKQMTKIGVFNPKTVRSITYIITFNSNDVVKSVERSDSEQPINITKDSVKAQSGKSKGVLRETFGGMGKYINMYEK